MSQNNFSIDIKVNLPPPDCDCKNPECQNCLWWRLARMKARIEGVNPPFSFAQMAKEIQKAARSLGSMEIAIQTFEKVLLERLHS